VSRTAGFFLFLAVAVAVFGGLHWYIFARLARDTSLPEAWRRAVAALLVAAALAVPVGMFLSRLLPRGSARLFSGILFVWMGTAFLLFMALLAADLVRLLGGAASWLADAVRRGPEVPSDPDRRVFMARAVAGGALLASGTASAAGIHSANGDPIVNEVPVKLERLPPSLSGLTIAQISDLHVGAIIRDRHVRRVVELTNAMRPDVVAITGDLVDASVAQLSHVTRALADLRARYGVFFVTGNHEYYSGAREWIEELGRCGVRVLRNERVAIGDGGPGGASIDLAGVDDWSVARGADGRWPALERALVGRDADRSLVLLAHQPRGVAEAVRSGVELQLSGHTHGGQIFPWSVVVSAVFPYYKGLYRHEEGGRAGRVFVSCGTGYWGPPMRIGAPAEIAKIVLT